MAVTDERDRELARLLIQHSTKAKKGELVYIHAVGRDTLGLAEAVVEEALRVGAAPHVHFVEPEISRKIIHGAQQPLLEKLRDFELDQMKHTACFIGIRGGGNIFETADAPRAKMALFNKHYALAVRDERVNHTRWVVLRYPNPSMAQLAMQPREKFAEFYYKVCTVDYAAMERAIKPLAKMMEKTDVVEIKGPGTDLRFSIKGIPVIPCAGEHNIPDGECFTAPVKKSIEGTVHFNAATVYEGTPFDQIKITFSKGQIVAAEAQGKEQTKKLNQILDQDEGARYVGEFAIGFNPHIMHPMRDILFDEKIAGSFHMAMGAAYDDASNGNKSAIHWDMVCIQRPDYGGGEIHFDGKLIRKDGIFIPKALHGLNPEAFMGGKKKKK